MLNDNKSSDVSINTQVCEQTTMAAMCLCEYFVTQSAHYSFIFLGEHVRFFAKMIQDESSEQNNRRGRINRQVNKETSMML